VRAFICSTCGQQYAESERPPERCRICEDERQYVGTNGQQWTTLEELRERHTADIREVEPPLAGIGMRPSFAIGQRALLVQTDEGNLLWDCIPLLDDAIVETVKWAGGIDAIAISHPHYYATCVDWASEFGARVLLHEADREWVTRPDPAIEFWGGETLEPVPGLTLLRLGGHFDGGTVLHWAERRLLLSGDIVQVVADPRWVSFMYSYPNLIPLPAREVQRIAAALERYDFDRIYGAWWDRVVPEDAKDVVRRSAERYVRAVER
jgi:glyoxylase-like metal-dependent hydrolase (beta-lactamase superfamily II)